MNRLIKGTAALSIAGALALAGTACGGADTAKSVDKSADSAPTNDRYATVLDERVSGVSEQLPASVVKFGGNSVEFTKGEKVRVAFIGYGRGFDYSVPEFDAAETEAKNLGMEVTSFDPGGDPQKQFTQLQDIMSSGKYNAAVVYPLSPDLTCDLMTHQMPAKGIVTVAIGNPACSDANKPGLLTVVPDTGGSAAVFDQWAKDIAAEGQKGDHAVLIAGAKLDFTTQLAEASLRKYLSEAGIELTKVYYTDFTQPDALQKAQDALQADPSLKIMAASFPEGTQGTVTAVKAAGRADNVKVFDFGGNRRALDDIEAGAVAGSSPFYPYTKVKTAFQALFLARAGEQVRPLYEYAGHAPESMRPSGQESMFITKDNVEAFRSEVAEY